MENKNERLNSVNEMIKNLQAMTMSLEANTKIPQEIKDKMIEDGNEQIAEWNQELQNLSGMDLMSDVFQDVERYGNNEDQEVKSHLDAFYQQCTNVIKHPNFHLRKLVFEVEDGERYQEFIVDVADGDVVDDVYITAKCSVFQFDDSNLKRKAI
jgi:cell wall assembly regulator SMI1